MLRLYVTSGSNQSFRTIVDTVLPLTTPIQGVDGTQLHEIAIPKGTLLLPSCQACNTLKTVWGEDAEEWKPDRWLSPLPPSVVEARIPGVYSNLSVSRAICKSPRLTRL